MQILKGASILKLSVYQAALKLTERARRCACTVQCALFHLSNASHTKSVYRVVLVTCCYNYFRGTLSYKGLFHPPIFDRCNDKLVSRTFSLLKYNSVNKSLSS